MIITWTEASPTPATCSRCRATRCRVNDPTYGLPGLTALSMVIGCVSRRSVRRGANEMRRRGSRLWRIGAVVLSATVGYALGWLACPFVCSLVLFGVLQLSPSEGIGFLAALLFEAAPTIGGVLGAVLGVRLVYYRLWPKRAFRARRICNACAYDLTGNVSGRYPECGTPVTRYSA
jgi:hypothetical protein